MNWLGVDDCLSRWCHVFDSHRPLQNTTVKTSEFSRRKANPSRLAFFRLAARVPVACVRYFGLMLSASQTIGDVWFTGVVPWRNCSERSAIS